MNYAMVYAIFNKMSKAPGLKRAEDIMSSGEMFLIDVQTALYQMCIKFGEIVDNIISIDINDDTVSKIFTGAGVTLATLFLSIEIFGYVANSMDLHGSLESAIKLGMRVICVSVVVQNLNNICSAISGLLRSSDEISFKIIFSQIGSYFAKTQPQITIEEGMLGINYYLFSTFLILVMVVVFVMFSMITIDCLQLIFETAVLSAISPIALSTLLSSTSRSTGISFIKAFAAVNMQWGIIKICIGLFDPICSAVISKFGSSATGVGGGLMLYLPTMLVLIVVTVMVKKSGEIARRALGT